MPNRLHPLTTHRLKTACLVGLYGAGLGVFVGGLEGRWVACRDFISLAPFSGDLLAICLAYLILLGGLGFFIGLAHKWKRPTWVMSGLTIGCAIWILPYQSSSPWAAVLGLAFVAAGCALFQFSSTKLRTMYFAFDALLVIALLAGYPGVARPSGQASSQRQPNIVLVVIDTLRADALSAYNPSPRARGVSPVIDSLAHAGTRFESAYAQAPWTRPSTASLFTGLYPASHGIVTPFDPLNRALPTIASMLKERGYQTVGFSANPQVSAAFGFHNGFDRFWNSTTRLQDKSAGVRLLRKWGLGKVEQQPARGVLHSTADDVNLAIDEWLAEDRTSAPTFLYVHYLDPHDPYTAPEDLLGRPRFANVEESTLYASQELPPYPLENSRLPTLSSSELSELQRRYNTEIRFVDDRLGKMLEHLRSKGVLGEQDFLILTSDHGEEFYEHKQWQHGRSLFEEMIHVPLIMMGPSVPINNVVQEPVELVDVLATIAAWSGGPPSFVQHGENLFGKRKKVGAFSHRPRLQHSIWSLRVAMQKVIWIQDGKELIKLAFNLSVDPTEAHTLSENESESFSGLHRRLEELIESSSEFRKDELISIELDTSAAQNLEQLGYIDGGTED